MVILATEERELGFVKNANITINPNDDKKEFSAQIARCYWNEDLTFGRYLYVLDTEFGGEIGEILTSTTLDYVELKGLTWRGMMHAKVIKPPEGSTHKVVSGELHEIMKELIEPVFDGLFVVSEENTGITVENYQFDRYCYLLPGLNKMLATVGRKVKLTRKRERGKTGYVLVEAVPIVDYSDQIELSKDCRLNYTMDDKRNGINHLIVTGKGELEERNVFDLYMWPDGSIRTEQYYIGKHEREAVYENTSTETAQLQSEAEEKFLELANKTTFKMDVAKLGIDVAIGDIVGGRDYLTGLYAAKPVENITYQLVNGIESRIYKLEGEDSE